MIPFVVSEPAKPAGPTGQKSDVPVEGDIRSAFGDLMAAAEMVADGTPVAADILTALADAEVDAEVASEMPARGDQQTDDQKVYVGSSKAFESPGLEKLGAEVAIVKPDTKVPVTGADLRVAKGPGKADLSSIGQHARPSGTAQVDTGTADVKTQRSSVAQSVVEGRIPQAVLTNASEAQAKITKANTAALDNAAPRSGLKLTPDNKLAPDNKKAQVADQRMGPVVPELSVPGNAAQRREESPRMVAAAEAPAPRAQGSVPMQPPAVVLAQVAGQPQKDIAEKNLKVVDAEITTNAVAADRHTPAPTVQGTAPATASPETARQAATPIAMAITNNGGKATEIALNPEELGRVRLNITAGDGAITLNVLAERPETQDLLRRHMDLLAQEFRDLGYTSISFTFGEQKDDARPETPPPDPVTEADGQASSDTPIIVPEQNRSGLDLRI